MTFIKKNLLNLILCLGELVVGILLLINPEGFTQAIIMALGVAVAVLGVLNVVRYFRADPLAASMDRRLAYGLGQLALGLFLLTQSGWLVGMFKTLTRLYGVAVLVLALIRIQQFFDARRLKLPRGGMFSGLTALFTLAYAAMILFMPETTWIFIGVMLLLEAVMDILILFFERRSII